MGLTVELKALFPITKLFKREKHYAKTSQRHHFSISKQVGSFCVTPLFWRTVSSLNCSLFAIRTANGAIPPQDGAFSSLRDLREAYDSS